MTLSRASFNSSSLIFFLSLFSCPGRNLLTLPLDLVLLLPSRLGLLVDCLTMEGLLGW